jgi:hypothetical protein
MHFYFSNRDAQFRKNVRSERAGQNMIGINWKSTFFGDDCKPTFKVLLNSVVGLLQPIF